MAAARASFGGRPMARPVALWDRLDARRRGCPVALCSRRLTRNGMNGTGAGIGSGSGINSGRTGSLRRLYVSASRAASAAIAILRVAARRALRFAQGSIKCVGVADALRFIGSPLARRLEGGLSPCHRRRAIIGNHGFRAGIGTTSVTGPATISGISSRQRLGCAANSGIMDALARRITLRTLPLVRSLYAVS